MTKPETTARRQKKLEDREAKEAAAIGAKRPDPEQFQFYRGRQPLYLAKPEDDE